MKQKVKDIVKTVLEIENTDLIISKRLQVPLSECKRLRRNNHNQSESVLFGKPIAITSSFWHLHSLKEIFLEETYRFRSDTHQPVIIDCGANIGLSAIYFKRLYPQARVIAFEPDPGIFELLQRNLNTFNYHDVELHQAAIWKQSGMLSFASNGSLGGSLELSGERNYNKSIVVQTPAVRLRDFLTTPVDFLKIDIEGAEYEVLADCSEQLKNVKHLFVEYHSTPHKKQELAPLLQIFAEAGFRVYIKEAWNNMKLPFLNTDYQPFWDLQLNIFGYRK